MIGSYVVLIFPLAGHHKDLEQSATSSGGTIVTMGKSTPAVEPAHMDGRPHKFTSRGPAATTTPNYSTWGPPSHPGN